MEQTDTTESTDQTETSEQEEEESTDQLDESTDESGEEEEDQLDNQESATIEIDGEEISLEELKLGYMRESDYRKKTQAIGDMKREIETQKDQRVQAGEADKHTPEEKKALDALDKLGIARQSEVENTVRRIIAQQQIVSERQIVQSDTGLDDDQMDAAQFIAIRKGMSLKQAASKVMGGKKVIKKKGISVRPNSGTAGSGSGKKKITPADIKNMDPNSKEFDEVVRMMEAGEL